MVIQTRVCNSMRIAKERDRKKVLHHLDQIGIQLQYLKAICKDLPSESLLRMIDIEEIDNRLAKMSKRAFKK